MNATIEKSPSKLSPFGQRAIIRTATGFGKKTVTGMGGTKVTVPVALGISEYYGNVSNFGGVVEIEHVSMGQRMVERVPAANVLYVQYLD